MLFKKKPRVGKSEKLLCHEVSVLSLCPCHLSHPNSRLESSTLRNTQSGELPVFLTTAGTGQTTPAGQEQFQCERVCEGVSECVSVPECARELL